MSDLRKDTRYESFAKVKIKSIGKKEFALKDLSVTGCRMECPAEIDIMPSMVFTLQIKPENDSKISSFNLEAESKWIRISGSSCQIGFFIIQAPKGKQFQRYVDYLSWRHSH